jgi:hypothetical protein
MHVLHWSQAAMAKANIEDIERAIGTLTPEEVEELRLWLDQYAGPTPLDRALEGDLKAGRLDSLLQKALDDEKNGKTRLL